MNIYNSYGIHIFLLVLIPMFVAIANDRTTGFDRNDPVAVVNGEPITAREFHLILDRHRIRSSQNALDISLQKSIEIKLQQSLAVQLGLLDAISYDSILEDLKEENARREALKASGGIVYGPIRFTEQMYYKHRMNKLIIALKHNFARRSVSPTDAELRKLYETIKHDLFRIHDRLQFKSYTLEQNTLTNYWSLFEAFRNGESVENITRKYGVDIRSDDIEVHDENAASHEKRDEDFYHQVADMQKGQYRAIPYATNPMIVYCVDRIPQGYHHFPEVKDIVYSRWVDREYEAMIEGLINTAQVTLNKEAWSQAQTWVK